MGRGRGRGRSDLTLDVAEPGESGAPAPVDEDISEPRPGRSARAAIWAFSAVEAGAFVFYFVLARSEWFFLDEWDFLANRTAFNVHDLFVNRENAHDQSNLRWGCKIQAEFRKGYPGGAAVTQPQP